MGLGLNMALGGQAGRKVGGLVRFDDHDVAVDNLHFVGAYRQFGRGASKAPVRRLNLDAGLSVENGDWLSSIEP
jgi:hypothetical protein